MAVRRLYHEQPESFAFTPENGDWADREVTKYPEGRQASAVIALLWRAQEQEGWITEPAIRHIADRLEMPYIRALEVATFYTMFQLKPVGSKAHVQVCGTTPCMLRGAEDIKAVCKRRIASDPFELSDDGAFSWEEVECLGACVNAPMALIGSDTYEDLTAETFEALLDAFDRGETPTPGPQVDRQYSEPIGGATSLSNGAAAPAPSKPATRPKAPAKSPARSEPASSVSPAGTAQGERPATIEAARDSGADDLKRIKGIGPKIERLLHELGIFHFDQIAAWTADNKAWVDGYLKFHGRIDREQWVEQARELATGSE